MTPENNVHPVPPVKSDDLRILRKIEDDGSITYFHPIGNATKTESQELSMVFDCIFERIDTLVWLMTGLDDERSVDSRAGYLLEALNAHAKRQVHEVMEFMQDTIGYIAVDIVSPEGDGIYRSGRVVGLNLEPSEKWKVTQAASVRHAGKEADA
ncbi:MAG: hypothetical protein M0Q01_08240 [Syntrophales bacterium]|jgi:hypothetical protein|nr:hypothetical protein [Syntrophales bacterium]